LRARATIMVSRRPGLAPFVRASNHSAKALAFGT
jgi:hypothetical protein